MSGVSSSKVVFTLRSKGFLLPDFLGFTTRLASDHGGRELQQHESASVSRRRPSSWIRTLTLNAWSWCGLCRISSREWCYCMMVSRAMPRLSSYTESRRVRTDPQGEGSPGLESRPAFSTSTLEYLVHHTCCNTRGFCVSRILPTRSPVAVP